MKKYTQTWFAVFVMISLFALGLLTVGAQDNAPQLQLTPDKAQAVAGDTVTVSVNVAGAVGVYGGSFKLSYDPQSFEVVQADGKAVTPGAFFANEPGFALRNAVDPATGTIEYAITLMQPAKPVNGDGILGTFTLHVLKDAPVTFTAINASFVAPEFKEVDGHMVAQKVNQVMAQVQGAVVASAPADVAVNSAAPVVAAAPVENAAPVQAAASNDTSTNMFNNLQLSNAPANNTANQMVASADSGNHSNNMVSIAAVAFLIIGVVLLTLSVGMYSRMRVHYTLAGNK